MSASRVYVSDILRYFPIKTLHVFCFYQPEQTKPDQCIPQYSVQLYKLKALFALSRYIKERNYSSSQSALHGSEGSAFILFIAEESASPGADWMMAG